MNELVQKLSSELYIEDLLDKKPENISGADQILANQLQN